MGAEDNFSFEPVLGVPRSFSAATTSTPSRGRRPAARAHAASAGGSAPRPLARRMLGLLGIGDRLAVLGRHRRLGPEQPGRLGLRHHQLRLLGRHRPRRHADLGDPLPVPPEVAHLDQPLRRGDDDLRRHVRADLPGHPRRPAVGGLLDGAGPEPDGHLAALPEPAAVGRLRGLDLRHGLGCSSGTSA